MLILFNCILNMLFVSPIKVTKRLKKPKQLAADTNFLAFYFAVIFQNLPETEIWEKPDASPPLQNLLKLCSFWKCLHLHFEVNVIFPSLK